MLFDCFDVYGFVLVFVLLCAPAFADEPYGVDFSHKMFAKLSSDEKAILIDYAKAYPTIKNSYQNMRMDVTEKSYNYVKSDEKKENPVYNSVPILTNDVKYEIRYNTGHESGAYRRIDGLITPVLSDDKSTVSTNDQPTTRRRVTLITPHEVFELQKTDLKNRYYALASRMNFEERYEKYGFVVHFFDTATYGLMGRELEEIVFHKPSKLQVEYDYVIDYVKPIVADGMDLVEIRSHLGDDFIVWTVRLAKNPWRVMETHYVDSKNNRRRAYCIYQSEFPENIPLLKSYRIDHCRYNDKTKTEQVAYSVQSEVTKLDLSPPPLSEFDIAQFLPSGSKVGVKTVVFTTVRIVFIVAGLVLFFIGVYMKVRLANKK
ncbi:MAG: hypothetical protein LBQ66_09065 [Planctomycetaceae bacterium]|jgi:hypothetical protein|nr:hypothetical protein [Planctomycetaceae bacterium]